MHTLTLRLNRAIRRNRLWFNRGPVALSSLLLFQCDLFGSSRSCPAMLFYDTATIEFTPAITQEGTWCFDIQFDAGHCASCVIVSASQPDAGVGSMRVQVPAALLDLPLCDDIGDTSVFVALHGDLIPGTYTYSDVSELSAQATADLTRLMPTLTYKAYLADELRYERTVVFSYQTSEPGGPNCGEVHHAAVEIAP